LRDKLLFNLMKCLLLALIAGLITSTAAAAPYRPEDDAEILERLPTRRSDPAMAALRTLRGAALARGYFELAMAEGDPRYVGYAEAALRGVTDPAAEVAFIRGLLKQYRHDFTGALQDLEEALRHDPEHVGARSWRAAIFMVGARYAAAREECRLLAEAASELLATGCRAYVDAATGSTRAAYRDLSAALDRRPDAPRELRLWALTRLAEMALRLDQRAAAERHFRDALALGINDQFLLAAYADFLLEHGRPKEVVALLANWTRSDTLLLRLALAENDCRRPTRTSTCGRSASASTPRRCAASGCTSAKRRASRSSSGAMPQGRSRLRSRTGSRSASRATPRWCWKARSPRATSRLPSRRCAGWRNRASRVRACAGLRPS
jgi:Tfp pilus assembly protein PilF